MGERRIAISPRFSGPKYLNTITEEETKKLQLRQAYKKLHFEKQTLKSLWDSFLVF